MDKLGRAWTTRAVSGQALWARRGEQVTRKRFYTLEEISRELHIAPATARNRLTLGLPMPPSIRVGRRRLFPVDEYERWIASQLTHSGGNASVGDSTDETAEDTVRDPHGPFHDPT
ncbi:DNA-binding protein [Paraburkholderia heleia]|uniref:DNA-binding protein n=1 Tax=Paraburkholderia heleia TaxID=634127 RepID=UPI0031D39269